MKRFKYSTDPKGFTYNCEAVAVREGYTIILTHTMLASSEEDAADFFTEWLENNLEGYDWVVTIKENEKKNESNKMHTA